MRAAPGHSDRTQIISVRRQRKALLCCVQPRATTLPNLVTKRSDPTSQRIPYVPLRLLICACRDLHLHRDIRLRPL
eukprot:8687039-Pyramimonas_sp.AAC.1